MSLSPAERSERARIAANARWAREPDRLAATAAGRSAAFQKILNEVDPHQELSEAQRYKLAKSAWNEHLSRMRFTVMRKRSKAKVGLASMGARPPKTVKATPRRDRQHRQHLKERLQRTWGPLIISPTPTPPSRRREAPGQPNDPGGGAPGRWH